MPTKEEILQFLQLPTTFDQRWKGDMRQLPTANPYPSSQASPNPQTWGNFALQREALRRGWQPQNYANLDYVNKGGVYNDQPTEAQKRRDAFTNENRWAAPIVRPDVVPPPAVSVQDPREEVVDPFAPVNSKIIYGGGRHQIYTQYLPPEDEILKQFLGDFKNGRQ